MTKGETFLRSKLKFNKLKNDSESLKNLDFFVQTAIPQWNSPEWGFPKGRNNKNESNIQCAMREFEEETGFASDDYTIIKSIKPLCEEFLGTNGIKYKHIYYVAYPNNDKKPQIDVTNKNQMAEIGDIGYYDYNSIQRMIRPYHTERKQIVYKLFLFFINQIKNNTKQQTLSN